MRCVHLSVLLVLLLTSGTTGESILNWFWKEPESNRVDVNGVPLLAIPYESTTDDDKFLQLAAKFTEIHANSPLEICQHKIVMKIKSSCSQMSEEEFGKLSVHLLNCQSSSEGRKVFPCTDEMSIKDCTKDMDADTWNSYHLMSNRARAVCYAARSLQFRALAELTVNKLVQTTHTQINALSSLKESQSALQERTSETLEMLQKESERLFEQQAHLKDAQIVTKNLLSLNLRKLNNEKSVIRAGHSQLTVMTDDVINRLGRVNDKVQGYSEMHDKYYHEVVNNLTSIQKQAQALLDKIQKSADQYDATLKKLGQINESINFLWDVTIKIRFEVEQRLAWLTNCLGSSEEQLKDAYRIIGHVVYLMTGMILAAFLHAPALTRFGLITIIPLNLATYWKYGSDAGLDFISITALISFITGFHYFIVILIYLFSSGTTKHSIDQSQSDYYKNELKNKDVKKTSLLRRIRNEIYYLGTSMVNLLHFLKGKLGMYFWSMISTVKSVTPRETLVRSCSYVLATKVYDNVVDDDMIPSDMDVSDDISGTDFEQMNRNNQLRQRHREREYVEDNYKLQPTRSLSPPRKICIGRTKSGSLCKLSTIKGYNYCARHLH